MKASDLIRRSWQTAEDKGWHDKPRSARVIAALFHSEVSEYVEEVRAGKSAFYESEEGAIVRGEYNDDVVLKPSGQAIELVDLAIRIGDYAGTDGWMLVRFGNFETSEEVAQYWATMSDEFREMITERLWLTDPLEFASALHEGIAAFSGAMSDLDISLALELLSRTLKSIVIYFVYRGWDFDTMFNKKDQFNQQRPFRHGGKLA